MPSGVLEEIRSRLTPSAEERRIVGYLTAVDRGVAQRFWTDLAGMSGWARRAAYAWTHLFPSSSYMRARYAIRQRWLVPFYYPYRWGRGLRSWWADRSPLR